MYRKLWGSATAASYMASSCCFGTKAVSSSSRLSFSNWFRKRHTQKNWALTRTVLLTRRSFWVLTHVLIWKCLPRTKSVSSALSPVLFLCR